MTLSKYNIGKKLKIKKKMKMEVPKFKEFITETDMSRRDKLMTRLYI